MTKLQLLHRALNERLMAAVEQVMEMVGGTVLEYEAETIRARKENEVLRRRLRWMEGDIPVDWPDEADPLVPEQLVNVEDDEPVFEGLSIKTEPIDASGSQSFIPDASLMAPVHTTDLETVNPETSQRVTSVDFPDTILWNSTESYMAPLDSDPTVVEGLKGKSRSQRMSFACPDCGKVFGREQTLMFHMRIHSAVRPYAYRRRKACFYGEKSRKKNLQGLSKLHPSKDIMDNIENTSIHSARSTSISPPWTSPCNSPEMASNKEINEVDTGSSKNTDSCAADTTEKRSKRGGKARWPRCLECRRAFKNVQRVRLHMVKAHGKVFPSQEYENEYEDADRAVKRPRKHKLSKGAAETERGNKELQDKTERGPKHPMKKIFEPNRITLESEGKSESRISCNKSERITDESSEITEVSKIIPEEPEGEAERKRSKKTFPCKECGKIYMIPGWLKAHERMHERQKMLKDNQRQKRRRKMERPIQKRRKAVKENLVEEIVVERKQKRKMKLIERQHSLENIGPTRSTNGAGKPLIKDESSGNQSPRAKKNSGSFICTHCDRAFGRRNWLNLHMLSHRQAMRDLQKTENDEPEKSHDVQMPKDDPQTEDSKVQKEKDRENGSYACPICAKVFRREVILMMHMQIHSNEKPYFYRQRKKQFYSDRTRPRVAKTFSQEPAIEFIHEREKDGGFTFSRNKTSPVFQEGTHATEPMETGQPHSVCTGRKFSRLPLQSNGASSSHSLNHPRTGSESDNHALSHLRLQPRIVLDPIIAKSKTWALCEEDNSRSVNSETCVNKLHQIRDIKTVDGATANTIGYSGKHHLSQTPPENMNACYDIQSMSGVKCTVISETDDPDILFVRLDLDGKSCENTSYPENVLGYIPPGDQQTTEHYDGRIRDRLEPELVAVETEKSGAPVCDIISSMKPDSVCSVNVSLSSESEKGNLDQCIAGVPPTAVSECMSSGSATCCMGMKQDSVCVIIPNDDDDNWLHISNNLNGKETNGNKIQTGQLSVKDGITNQLAQLSSCVEPLNGTLCRARDQTAPETLSATGTIESSLPSTSQKSPDLASDVMTVIDITEETNACDGLLANREEILTSSNQRTEENFKVHKSSPTCTICDLKFASLSSLSRHILEHSTSGSISKGSSIVRTLKKTIKNQETNIKQDHFQSSEVHGDDATVSSAPVEAKTTKSTGGHLNVNHYQNPKESPKPLTKCRGSKESKETLYCRFCKKACRKLELHLQYDHPEEPEVMEALHFTKTPEERMELLSQLCSKESSELGITNTLIDEDLINCLFCQGSYQRNQFWNHALVCEQKQPEKMLTLPEDDRSVHTQITSSNTRPSRAPNYFDLKSVYPIDIRAQQSLPESLSASSPEVNPSTMQSFGGMLEQIAIIDQHDNH
ncbi:uncharacterized protein zgc:66474 isoform X2 [Hoplias malabaricus]|uniref:uncharacterized protein zgc:66474 isoform X2 n=1 Tax=Hoplias malabaricus TaxID=27720 RepID=UPI003461EAD4